MAIAILPSCAASRQCPASAPYLHFVPKLDLRLKGLQALQTRHRAAASEMLVAARAAGCLLKQHPTQWNLRFLLQDLQAVHQTPRRPPLHLRLPLPLAEAPPGTYTRPYAAAL